MLDNRIIISTDSTSLSLEDENLDVDNGKITSISANGDGSFVCDYGEDEDHPKSRGDVNLTIERDGYSFIPPTRTMTVHNNVSCALQKDLVNDPIRYVELAFSEKPVDAEGNEIFTEEAIDLINKGESNLLVFDPTSTGCVLESYERVSEYIIRLNFSTYPEQAGTLEVTINDPENVYSPNPLSIIQEKVETKITSAVVGQLTPNELTLNFSARCCYMDNKEIGTDVFNVSYYNENGENGPEWTNYDTLIYEGDPDVYSTSLSFKLMNKVFIKDVVYRIYYSGTETQTGNYLFDVNGVHPVSTGNKGAGGLDINNNSNYTMPTLQGATVLGDTPDKLNLIFSQTVQVADNTKLPTLTIDGFEESYYITGWDTENGQTVTCTLNGALEGGMTGTVSIDGDMFHDGYNQYVSASRTDISNYADTGISVIDTRVTKQGIVCISFSVDFDCTNPDTGLDDISGWQIYYTNRLGQGPLLYCDMDKIDWELDHGTEGFRLYFNVSVLDPALTGNTFDISYDESHGYFKSAGTGEALEGGMWQNITNMSELGAHVSSHTSTDYIDTMILGHKCSSAEEVEYVLRCVKEDCQVGLSQNYLLGDLLSIPHICVKRLIFPKEECAYQAYDVGPARFEYWGPNHPDYENCGGSAFNTLTNQSSWWTTDFRIVAIDWYSGKNIDPDQRDDEAYKNPVMSNVCFMARNPWSSDDNRETTSTSSTTNYYYAGGCPMNPYSNTNAGGYKETPLRNEYLIGDPDAGYTRPQDGENSVMLALDEAGIKMDLLTAIKRPCANGGSSSVTGYDIIEDKIMIPAEYEYSGWSSTSYRNSTYENATTQDRMAFFTSSAAGNSQTYYNKIRWMQSSNFSSFTNLSEEQESEIESRYYTRNTVNHVWHISPSSSNDTNFCVWSANFVVPSNYHTVDASNGLSPCFLISDQ